MLRTTGFVTILLVMLGVTFLTGCGGGGSDCNNCESVNTTVVINGMHQKDPSVFVSGNIAIPPSSVQADCTFNSTGSQSFTGTTDANGVLTVSSVAIGTNCAWSLFRNTSNLCPTQNLVTRIFDVPGKNFELQCGSEVNTFLASPNKVDPTAPPATITITGQNMDPTYAMPRVYFYDQNQTVWLQVTATSASADGTQIVIPASQVTFPDTYYAAVVFVLRANGSWDAVGGAAVRVFTPISPPPGGGGGCTGRNCLPQC